MMYHIFQNGCRIKRRRDVMLLNTLERLRQLLTERGWTEYRLSKECGLSQSTIGNIFRRNTTPSLETLSIICSAFGLTLSQFFADGEVVELTPDLRELFSCWVSLSPEQKSALLSLLQTFNETTFGVYLSNPEIEMADTEQGASCFVSAIFLSFFSCFQSDKIYAAACT